jgi:N-acetylglucosamine-6-phosphate deacetylase
VNPDQFVLTGARVAGPDGVLDRGWLAVSGERIAGLGGGAAPGGTRRLDLRGGLVVPGFVDIHCHGGGGASFSAGDATEAATAIQAHRGHGTTTMLASLVSDPLPALADQMAALSGLVTAGELAGIHLEGPFIAQARCGAHDPAALREPDRQAVDSLLAAGHDQIRMVTLAPELTGGIDAVRRIVDAGVIAAIGHTDAVAEQIQPAVTAGASVATHLFNGMRPLHHREPGPVGVLLDDERVTVELICDLVHVHPSVLRLAARHAGPSRIALVTDAMSATDAADGHYTLGRLGVEVSDGIATLAGNGALAGSTLTMDAAFRNLVTGVGMSIEEAVAATSRRPADLLGIADRTGALRPGLLADLVILDEQFHTIGVMRRGGWIVRPGR